MSTTTTLPLYRQLAAHYRGAIEAGSLQPGARLPSLRSLMQLHDVSLSTALQLCRTLESDGWAEARERSGYFVRRPQRLGMAPMDEPDADVQPDPAQYVGIHSRVSDFVARRRAADVKLNLSIARAAPQFYPADALRAAMTRALRLHPELVAGVPPLRGDPQFRTVLAKRAVAAGMVLSPDEVLVTNGCIEALNLALRAVAQPGDTIAVESPTFYGLLQVLESLGLRALEIPTSPQTGLSIEALELAARTYGDIKAVVVVPHLQNPLGSVMPDAHKQRLVQLCDAQGIALIEDDTYTELLDAEQPPRAIKSWDATGNVIHCASMHKILAPGLRLGWISAGRWQARVEMLKYTQSRNNEVLSQRGAGEFMATGAYDRHLRRLRTALRSQRERTAEAIAKYFPEGTRLNLPPGGLQLWVELPAGCASAQVFDAALQQGILVAPGFLFSNSARSDHFLRLNCGWPYDAEIDGALRTLGGIAGQVARAA
ncbi:PLP-dependent aminotransferase family protein [Variovorax guangxiensis]|uniref:PLP-dependent aminotransferase family protein n=1 Tax=Variovorax guangxiensis TaxID=1775474 RepID=A0A502DUY2_9BURK|nr:PLP-dependent aminotransferase family protein [Variovorax guangxiensis]TPG25036.1 PLP-dependent aminotransferase family protein [Variovorax ginsengisoli]TPG29288.1 PLP-dependent aminotransferase family protein [Variovorax guangxiensis]